MSYTLIQNRWCETGLRSGDRKVCDILFTSFSYPRRIWILCFTTLLFRFFLKFYFRSSSKFSRKFNMLYSALEFLCLNLIKMMSLSVQCSLSSHFEYQMHCNDVCFSVLVKFKLHQLLCGSAKSALDDAI